MFHRWLVVGVFGSLIGTTALAAPAIHPCDRDTGNTATLAASARETVIPDEAAITLSASEHAAHGKDVAAATRRVLRTVRAAIALAAATPGIVAATTGFQTIRDYRFVSGTQVPDGWWVRDEIVLTSRHLNALGDLTGRLSTTLHVEAMSTRISSRLRERVERSLTKKAIASFRAKAANVTRDFGLQRFGLCTIDVGGLEGDRAIPRPVNPMLAAARVAAGSPLPIAPGQATLSVTVSGSIRMQ